MVKVDRENAKANFKWRSVSIFDKWIFDFSVVHKKLVDLIKRQSGSSNVFYIFVSDL